MTEESTQPGAGAAASAEDAGSSGRWFGDESRLQLGWLSVPRAGLGGSAVVIAPPIGYPYLSSHRTLRTVAEALAARGHVVFRIDYDGTGDSAGDQWDEERVAAWRDTLRLAVAEVRVIGVERVTLLGVRLGATLALLDGADLGADAVIAWAPVTNGRRYAKELRLMSMQVPDDVGEQGTIAAAGNVFSARTLEDLRGLSLDALSGPPARRVLVIDAPAGAGASVSETLSRLGGEVELREVSGGETALETATEFATVPQAVVTTIGAFVGDSPAGDGRPPVGPAQARMPWRGGTVVEELLTLGPEGFRALLTRPVDEGPDAQPSRATLVLLNSGSETHIGPGRMWVELARDLALLGHPVVRVDMRGWGESPDNGGAPGRPYDEGGIQDTRLIVRALHAAGHERLVLSGLCASSWIALHALPDCPDTAAVVFNPQLFWHRGIPLRVDPEEVQRAVDIMFRHHPRGARWHLWDALDMLHARPLAGRWLARLAAIDRPIRMIFTPDDVGLAYLNTRLARQIRRVQRSGQISVEVLPGIDHPLHRTWLREQVTTATARALADIETKASATTGTSGEAASATVSR